jgi:hypothetical protein
MTWRGALLWGFFLLGSFASHAQVRTVQDETDLINWYYAATYGTGVYTAGDRTVAVLQLPLAFVLRAPSDESYGLRLTLPLSFGFYGYEFNDVLHGDLPSRLSTVSVMPGVEFETRINRRWTLRPYVAAGYGTDFDGENSALLYDVGLRSRYLLAEDRGVEVAMLNRLSLAGFNPSGGPNQPFSLFALGMEVFVPTGTEVFGRPLRMSLAPIYYYYFKRLWFPEFTDPDNRIRHEAEFAVMLSTGKPWSFVGMDFDRIGIAVRTGEGVTGVRIFTSLPF